MKLSQVFRTSYNMNDLCKPRLNVDQWDLQVIPYEFLKLFHFRKKIADVFILKNCLIFGCNLEKSANPQSLQRYKGTAKMDF